MEMKIFNNITNKKALVTVFKLIIDNFHSSDKICSVNLFFLYTIFLEELCSVELFSVALKGIIVFG